MKLHLDDTINALPSFTKDDLAESIRTQLKKIDKTVIVLDDDPTGTQTVHSVPVLTVWDTESIERELRNGTSVFYILTNSRSMSVEKADDLHRLIGGNISIACQKYNREFILISRGDSTLRGHFPNDIIALADGMQIDDYKTIVIPAFFEGGRYTINDKHYVKEGEQLVPVSETYFAKDKVFGFSHSDLKEWVEEKSLGVIKSDNVVSFSIEELRGTPTEMIVKKINTVPEYSTCIVNAAAYYDLQKFALSCLYSSARVLFRTAASFISAISGIEQRTFLSKSELVGTENLNGGLIVVGSFVPQTTIQLDTLLHNNLIESVEVDVDRILNDELRVSDIADFLDQNIKMGKDVVVYTSRLLQTGADEIQNLAISRKVSDFITTVVARITIRPGFLVAKGGITSSDIATKALGIQRAIVLGQVLPGVPVWKSGVESKFPDLPYIIFPGNVGDDKALSDLYRIISSKQ